MKKFDEHLKHKPLIAYFVRHGQCENQGKSGVHDPPLTVAGERQAERVAQRLAEEKFDHIYSSTARRARDTAAQIIKFHEKVPYTETGAIVEISKDHFLSDPKQASPERRHQVEKEYDTMVRFMNHLRHNHNDGERILIIAHGNLILSMISVLGGKKPYQSTLIGLDNTSVTVVHYWSAAGLAVIKLANCVKHLETDNITS